MLNISKYLEKIKKNLNSGEILNNSIVEIINKHTNLDIKTNDFDLNNNIIKLKISPGAKNKIFMFKEGIVKEIEENSGLKNIQIR